MVLRILKNPVYIGVLEQGRVTTPSYKVKRLVNKPREEWAVVENCHEPIVDRNDFESVQKVLALDTRTSVSGKAVELFSGMVCCGECGGAMIRRTVNTAKKKYTYYICAAHKNEKTCYAHCMRDITLNEIVLESLKKHIQDVIDLSDLLELTDTAELQQADTQKLRMRLDQKQEEIDRYQALLRSLYENLADGVIDRNEYQDLKKNYAKRREEAEAQSEALRGEMELELRNFAEDRVWMQQFRKHQNIEALDRSIIVSLIERVMVFRDQRVEIVYRWQNEFRHQEELFLQAQALSKREVV